MEAVERRRGRMKLCGGDCEVAKKKLTQFCNLDRFQRKL